MVNVFRLIFIGDQSNLAAVWSLMVVDDVTDRFFDLFCVGHLWGFSCVSAVQKL